MESVAAGNIHFIMVMKGAGGWSAGSCVNIDEKGGGINICIINQNTGDNLELMHFLKRVGAKKHLKRVEETSRRSLVKSVRSASFNHLPSVSCYRYFSDDARQKAKNETS